MKQLRILCLVCALATLAACHPQSSAPGKPATSVVATVNGTPISQDFYEFYIKGITGGRDSSTLTPRQRAMVLDSLIRAEAVAQQATKEGLQEQPSTASLLRLSRLHILEQAASDKFLAGKTPSDAQLQAEYNAEVAQMPKIEYHAEHILVKSKTLAEKVIQDLEHGGNFAMLAKKYSIDPSKANGGDLGWFTLNHMVKPFSDALARLKIGEYTHTPVHTQYGWHVIKLLGTRPLTPPPFAQVKQRLVQIVEAKQFRAYTDTLIGKGKVVTYLDTQTDQLTKGQAGPPAVPAAPANAG